MPYVQMKFVDGCDGNGTNGVWGAAGWGLCALEKMDEGDPEVRA